MRIVVRHRSCYRHPRPTLLGPQLIRLRPADYVRARVERYYLQIGPSIDCTGYAIRMAIVSRASR